MTVAADQSHLVSRQIRLRLLMAPMRKEDPNSYLLSQAHRQVRIRREEPEYQRTDLVPHMARQVPGRQPLVVNRKDLRLRTAAQMAGSQGSLHLLSQGSRHHLSQVHLQVKVVGLVDLVRDRLDRQILNRFSMILRENLTVREVSILVTLLNCHLNRMIHRRLVDRMDENELVLTLQTLRLKIMTHQDLKAQMKMIGQDHTPPRPMITMAMDQLTLERPRSLSFQPQMAEMTLKNLLIVEPAKAQLALVDRPAHSQTRL